MRTLTVRQVEDQTANIIAQKAKAKGLSMEAEVRAILKQTAVDWERKQNAETGYDMAMRVRSQFTEIGGADDYADILDTLERPPAREPVTFD